MRTRLTDLLGIEHPVMLAGMGGVSYHRLVSTVSEAGGFGCLGASTMSPTELVDEIRAVKKVTGKPFGVDLLTAIPEQLEGNIDALVRESVPVLVAGLGIPRDVVTTCHEHNIIVVNMCGKVRHAIAAVEAGCDLVVAQGTEAGGHTGTVATMPLVPQIVDAVGDRVPVVAAGGIFDGRGLAAALALGADGVWIGTRFIATPEARSAPGYKDALLRTPEDGTVVSRAFTGKTLRAVRNKTTQHFDEHPEELTAFPNQLAAAVKGGWMHLGADEHTRGVDPDRECYPAGQGVGAIHDLVPAAELVHRFVAEAEAAVDRIAAARAAISSAVTHPMP
jgi:enoyl-[acyl-carrier protein] reductase II